MGNIYIRNGKGENRERKKKKSNHKKKDYKIFPFLSLVRARRDENQKHLFYNIYFYEFTRILILKIKILFYNFKNMTISIKQHFTNIQAKTPGKNTCEMIVLHHTGDYSLQSVTNTAQ